MPKFVRVYSGDDGQSKIEELDFEMQDFVDSEGAHGKGTPMQNAGGVTFREYAPGYFLDFHTAPRRQYSITLSGQVEVAVPDGTTMLTGPGTVLLAEDLTGSGHSTRVVGTEPRFALIVPLPD
jgi:hypothetical protein